MVIFIYDIIHKTNNDKHLIVFVLYFSKCISNFYLVTTALYIQKIS